MTITKDTDKQNTHSKEQFSISHNKHNLGMVWCMTLVNQICKSPGLLPVSKLFQRGPSAVQAVLDAVVGAEENLKRY